MRKDEGHFHALFLLFGSYTWIYHPVVPRIGRFLSPPFVTWKADLAVQSKRKAQRKSQDEG